MRLLPRTVLLLLIATCASMLGGCGGSESEPSGESPASPSKDHKPLVLGNLIKPFDPPRLQDLDAQADWVDQPVLDSLELLRKRQQGEKSLATVKEALTLRNQSPAENAKILSAMGRLPGSDAEVNWDAVMVRYEGADVKSTNPLMISSTVEFDVLGLTGFGLFGFNWEFKPHATKDSVVSWQTSKDRMYDKVVMRDDLTWSDGKPITAHDVVFSFKLIMTEEVPVPAVRSGTDKLKWIEAYDDHTLVFFHQEALATNVWNLNFPIVPRHIYEQSVAEDPTLQDSEYHVRQEDRPVSGGPYVVASRKRGQEIVLKRMESYYMHNGKQVRDKPYFAEVRFRVMQDPSVALLALKRGDLDEMTLDPEQWKTQTEDEEFYRKNTKAYGTEWVYFYFCWNAKCEFFSDARVRKAMSYAFNYDELLQKLLLGLYEPCNGVFHPSSPWAPKDDPPQPFKQDLHKAEQLLEEAGWVDHDGDGIRDKQIGGRSVRFDFTVLTPNIPSRINICNLLRENLDQIGIVCNVRPLEFTVLQEKTRVHEFHAFLGGWGTGTDPDTADNIWVTGEGRNYGEYSNPEVDRLFAEGRKEFDLANRVEIYRRIARILWDDQPYTWLYFRNSFYAFSKSLRGYNFSPRGPYNYGPGFSAIWKPRAL